MARGITELDVHGAADALVAKGERPAPRTRLPACWRLGGRASEVGCTLRVQA